MIDRRMFLAGASALAVLAAWKWFSGGEVEAGTFEVVKTDAEWRRLLTPAQYDVLRGHGTEPAGSSPLDREKRKGVFACAGCELPLFSSETKFDSGTGWPSFYRPLANAVGTSTDYKLVVPRTEVHCTTSL